jgi:hypothetical protein
MVEVRYLDLSSLDSVRQFANDVINIEPRLDVLINNAGAGGIRNKMTADNLQLGMQVNHFGPFLLTCLLLGKILSARAVTLTSSFKWRIELNESKSVHIDFTNKKIRQQIFIDGTQVPYANTAKYVKFEVFTAVTMKNGVFWDVTPCGYCKNRRFGGTSALTRAARRNIPEDTILHS